MDGFDAIMHFIETNINWPSLVAEAKNLTITKKEPVDVRFKRAMKYHQQLGGSLDYLGAGAFRMAFGMNGYAVKIAFNTNGIEDLQKEHRFWNALPEEFKPFFSDCYYVSECYGIYKLAPLMESEQVSIYTDEMKQILTILSQRFIVNDNWVDIRKNWGIYQGKPIIVDYAGCEIKI